jgi:hypothetical protein
MDEYKVVISQEESPASLTTHEILRSVPELKVAMIGDNLVVTFGFVYGLGPIRNRVPVGVFTLLVNDATCGESGSIDFYPGESFRCPNG